MPNSVLPDDVLAVLGANADRADSDVDWPAESWDAIVRAGVTGWNVPTELGGVDRGAVEVFEGYEQLAGACLTTTFILSQRDAAVRRIAPTLEVPPAASDGTARC